MGKHVATTTSTTLEESRTAAGTQCNTVQQQLQQEQLLPQQQQQYQKQMQQQHRQEQQLNCKHKQNIYDYLQLSPRLELQLPGFFFRFFSGWGFVREQYQLMLLPLP